MAGPRVACALIPSGPSTRRSRASSIATPIALGEQGTEEVEAGVRVDPAGAGPGEHGLALERQAGGVGEEVADGGAGRARRLVEVDHAVIDGVEHGKGGHELGHRRPPERVAGVAVAGDDPVRTDDRRGGVVGAPVVDGSERGGEEVVHGG